MKRYSKRNYTLISLALFLIPMIVLVQQASALEIGPDTTSGDSVLFFRDVNNMDNSTVTMSLDGADYLLGDIVTLTITDVNANVDLSMAEFLSVVVNSTSDPVGITIFPEETGPSTGVFMKSFTLTSDASSDDFLHIEEGDTISVSYDTQPTFAGRFMAQLFGVDVDGYATMFDYIVTDDEEVNNCFVVVTDAVIFQLNDVGLGTPTATSTTVTMSYANAIIGGNIGTPTIFNQAVPEGQWVAVASSIDPGAKTITTSDPISTGGFVIGFDDPGCSGGAGGGIARAGLVVNALGFLKTKSLAAGGGGGGGGNSPPLFGQSSFAIISGGEEGFGGIINDNNVNTLEETKTFKVGEKAVLRFELIEGGGIGKIEHAGFYINVREGQKRQDSDAYIYFNPLKSPQVTVHDPNGLFSEVNFELLQEDVTKFVLKYDLTFAKPMVKSDLILESWNIDKWSTLNKIPNAIEVLSSGIVQETASEQSEEPIVDTFVEDVTDDHVVPIWVKTNAKWWSDGTIDNENFISGIEYLVNEGIISVSLTEGTDDSISEMPSWIKNTAGWWADEMISEDEFITAIEWMITNNIIQVAA